MTLHNLETGGVDGPELRAQVGRERVNYAPDGMTEYTLRHREVWPILVRGPEAETLDPNELHSWNALWGRLGVELFQCFRMGDQHIRTDMIGLARSLGGWRGEIVADRLDQWRRRLAS